MSDEYGNYQANIVDPMSGFQQPNGHSGSGSPEGVVTSTPGDYYVDVDTGNLYVKQTGDGDTGWTLVVGGGGGGGATELYFSATDVTPNAAVTATRPALYYTSQGSVWVKTGAGATNTGWEQILAAP